MSERLLNGGACQLPDGVAECPECGGYLHVRSIAWDAATGLPLASALEVECEDDENIEHRYWQSDWQPVRDAVARWAKAINE